MKSLIEKIFNTKISTSYMFILFGVSALMLTGYFSYAWFTVQGVQQYSVVTGNLYGTVAIGTSSVAINGQGVITYTPTTDSDTITLTVTNTNDRTVKNSIYYYNPSDSNIQIGYTSDSPTIPNTTGVSVDQNKTLTYKIKINNAKGKQIKIGSSIGLSNSNLTLPSETTAFSLLKDPTGAETLIAKANPETLDYNNATDDQKNQMWAFAHEATEQLKATIDYRYIGANPNNYVKFNDELWRIIGVFDVDDGTGKIEKRMKIIRNISIGDYSWDNSTTESSNGTNNWLVARLNYLLNPGHESETYGGSLYWNRKSGTCYGRWFAGNNNATTSCNFTSTGLTDEAKTMIGDAKWYLGGSSTEKDVTSSMFYTRERGTTVYSGRNINWTGKVGLMYPSDYGYATSGGNSTNRASCMAKELYNWQNDNDCKNNDWLYIPSQYQDQWTMCPSAADSHYVFCVTSIYGFVGYSYAYDTYVIRPVVHLKSTIKITGGTGSSTDPFILG